MKDIFNTVHIYGNKTLYSYHDLNISALKKLAKNWACVGAVSSEIIITVIQRGRSHV